MRSGAKARADQSWPPSIAALTGAVPLPLALCGSEHLQQRGGVTGVDDERWRASLFKELNVARKERQHALRLAGETAAALERLALDQSSRATAAALAKVQESLDRQSKVQEQDRQAKVEYRRQLHRFTTQSLTRSKSGLL